MTPNYTIEGFEWQGEPGTLILDPVIAEAALYLRWLVAKDFGEDVRVVWEEMIFPDDPHATPKLYMLVYLDDDDKLDSFILRYFGHLPVRVRVCIVVGKGIP